MTIFNYFSGSLKRVLTYSFLLLLLCAQSQNGITGNRDWQIKPVISRGFIMIHRISIGHLVKGYPTTYELNLSKPSLGNKLWHLENNHPDLGISLQCLDFANHPQLGYAFTLAPYVEIPLNEKTKASRVYMRILWGGTYITKRFDIHENRKNIAIGSHLNAFVQFRWFWNLRITDRLQFQPGITFSHASNGRARNPNLGLNVMSLSAGLNYRIYRDNAAVTVIDSSSRRKSRNEIVLQGAVGFNERGIGTPELRSYLLAASYQRNVRNTHKWSAGLDLYYDENYQQDFEEKKSRQATGFEKYRMAARLGYAYNIGRISLPIELGYYVYQKVNPDAVIVSRLGLRYYDKSGLILSFGLRTHFAVAYTFEYGLGYCLPLRK